MCSVKECKTSCSKVPNDMGVSCNLGIMNFDQYNISADKGTGINDIITAYVLGN